LQSPPCSPEGLPLTSPQDGDWRKRWKHDVILQERRGIEWLNATHIQPVQIILAEYGSIIVDLAGFVGQQGTGG
jgi:hypothetical protein